MVILIGAEGCTGKTLMAQRLLEIYKIPYISADHIKMGLYRANPSCGFTPTSDPDIIERHLWPILREIVHTNIENHQHLIVEGCYIYPRRIKEFTQEYRPHIIPVFMGFSRGYLERHFQDGVLRHRDIIESREDEERDAAWFADRNERFKAMCRESGERYFEIDQDYARDTAAIYAWIASEAYRIGRNTI